MICIYFLNSISLWFGYSDSTDTLFFTIQSVKLSENYLEFLLLKNFLENNYLYYATQKRFTGIQKRLQFPEKRRIFFIMHCLFRFHLFFVRYFCIYKILKLQNIKKTISSIKQPKIIQGTVNFSKVTTYSTELRIIYLVHT